MNRTIRYTLYISLIILCIFIVQGWKGDHSLLGINIGGDNVEKRIVTNSESVEERYSEVSIPGMLSQTNSERLENGLLPLSLNQNLSNSASEKVDDMFEKQYFEHESPSGETVADLAKNAGYDFQSISENLALGNFSSDEELINAWMESPSHRKNLLDPKFTEIGLAAKKAELNGETKWLAVQHFGKPTPNCSPIKDEEKEKINKEKSDVEIEEMELKKMAYEIESKTTKGQSQEFLDAYNMRARAYNLRLSALKELIKEYNAVVDAYNTCMVL